MLVDSIKCRGDTLVEVLFATAVFSLVAVGCLSIMNQGTATAQRALEITLVRNEIDAQAEALRFLNASYVSSYPDTSSSASKEWKAMQDSIASNNPSNFGVASNTCPSISDLNSDSFVLNARKALFKQPSSDSGSLVPLLVSSIYSKVVYDSDDNAVSAQGIWIEPIKVWPVGNAGYIDFHIRACWDSPGQSVPMTLGTIVRLYAPH